MSIGCNEMELRFNLPDRFETELQQIVIVATHLAIEESKKTGHMKGMDEVKGRCRIRRCFL